MLLRSSKADGTGRKPGLKMIPDGTPDIKSVNDSSGRRDRHDCIRDVTEMDVILGRGMGYQDRPGNRRMRAIVGRHKDRYQKMGLTEKRHLVEEVYNEVTRDGARFLHKQGRDEGFTIVTMPVSLQKVRNLLRCKHTCSKKMTGSIKTNTETANSSEGQALKAHAELSLSRHQASTIAQGNSAAQVGDFVTSSRPLPQHYPSAPILPIGNVLQQTPLAFYGVLDPSYLFVQYHMGPPATRYARSMPVPWGLPEQSCPLATGGSAARLQLLQQHHHRLSAEIMHLFRSKRVQSKQQEEPL